MTFLDWAVPVIFAVVLLAIHLRYRIKDFVGMVIYRIRYP